MACVIGACWASLQRFGTCSMARKSRSKVFGYGERTVGKDERLTPPHILKALGGIDSFDLDPCAPVVRPWAMAQKHYTIEDDGLRLPWKGTAFVNPPYEQELMKLFISKLGRHGDGVALTFARTETGLFWEEIWEKATGVFFIKGRLIFYNTDGTPVTNEKTGKPSAAGAPSVLIPFGKKGERLVLNSGLEGFYFPMSAGIRIPPMAQMRLI